MYAAGGRQAINLCTLQEPEFKILRVNRHQFPVNLYPNPFQLRIIHAQSPADSGQGIATNPFS
jgi:hypothetical protein